MGSERIEADSEAAGVRKRAGRRGVGRFWALRTLFLLDLIEDPRSRTTLAWALGTVLVGAIVYHFIEGWDYLTALYFCVITLATIGFGDITPQTQLGRWFTIFYAINGIVTLLALFDQIRIVRGERRRQPEDSPRRAGGLRS